MDKSTKAGWYFLVGFILAFLILLGDSYFGSYKSFQYIVARSILSGIVALVFYLIFYNFLDRTDKDIKKWEKLSKSEKIKYNKEYEEKTKGGLSRARNVSIICLISLLLAVVTFFFSPPYLEWISGFFFTIFLFAKYYLTLM